MKSWGPLSRHGTAEGGRGPARPTRRMPRLHSHRAPGRMSEFAAGEPVGPTEQPVRPTEQPVLASELPVQHRNCRCSPRICGRGQLGAAATLHDLRLPGGQAGGHGGTGPRLLGRRHASVLGARCGPGGRRILDGILSRSDRCSRDPTPPAGRTRLATGRGPPRHLQHRDVHLVFGCPDPVVGHAGPLPVPGRQPEDHRCRLDNRRSLRDRISGDNGRAHFRQRGNRTAPGLGPAVARQPELRAEAGHRGCPRPRRDQNSPRPAVCLGTGAGCLARRLYPHASTRTDPGRRREPQPSGGTRPPLRRALPQAPRPQSVDQFRLLHRCADCSSPDPPAGNWPTSRPHSWWSPPQ